MFKIESIYPFGWVNNLNHKGTKNTEDENEKCHAEAQRTRRKKIFDLFKDIIAIWFFSVNSASLREKNHANEEKRNGTRRRKERRERKSSIYLKKIIAIWFSSAISASPREKRIHASELK